MSSTTISRHDIRTTRSRKVLLQELMRTLINEGRYGLWVIWCVFTYYGLMNALYVFTCITALHFAPNHQVMSVLAFPLTMLCYMVASVLAWRYSYVVAVFVRKHRMMHMFTATMLFFSYIAIRQMSYDAGTSWYFLFHH